MGFTVRQDCPQCGAPVDLEETDHIMHCPYCEVKSFLFTPNYFRYVLPNKAPEKEIIYAPYLRFKGKAYYCSGSTVGHRIVDITHKGVPLGGIPLSLGVRPQAMKMRFVTPKTEGSFLRFSLKASDILTKAARLSSTSASGELYHRAFIGETLSLIYLPLYFENNRLFDAILNKPLAPIKGEQSDLDSQLKRSPQWALTFIPTLCPHCGWNLEGQRDSVVLTCSNCESAWEASEGKWIRVAFLSVPNIHEEARYLPFWRITVKSTGVEINSYADFIRVTNQPKVVGKEQQGEDMHFWSPAFKIRPKVYLQLSRQMTVSQKQFESKERIPRKHLFPVTLPQTEAVQSLKLTLASAALHKKNVFPFLPRTRFDIKEKTLVYLPFVDTGHEYVQEHIRVSVNKNSLEYGRNL